MKFYATVTSERDSRPGKKGGNEALRVELSAFGKVVGHIVLEITGGHPSRYTLKYSPFPDGSDWTTLKEGRQNPLPIIQA